MMDAISSISMSTPFAGLQQAQSQMDQGAAVIANPSSSVVSLSSAAVSMQGAGVAMAANIAAIKAEDKAMGMLIDLLA